MNETATGSLILLFLIIQFREYPHKAVGGVSLVPMVNLQIPQFTGFVI